MYSAQEKTSFRESVHSRLQGELPRLKEEHLRLKSEPPRLKGEPLRLQSYRLKVHKIENFFGSEFEFYTISL